MAKGLFITFPGHGHVNPTIGLVCELINKGDEIVYISSEEFREKLERVGATFKGYELGTGTSILSKVIHAHEKAMPIAFEENETYDYLVVDPFIHPGKKLIEKLKIKKVISTVTTFALCEEMTSFIFRSNSQMEQRQHFANIRGFSPKFEELEQRYGMTFPRKMQQLALGSEVDLSIVFTSQYYQPLLENYDSTYKFVGPSIFDRKEEIDFNVDNPENKKIVYVSLGTTFANQNIEFYHKCFAALGSKEDVLVIMSVGKTIHIDSLGDIPKNFAIYPYVPQLELLKQVDLFITHGGMNSTSEAFYHGVPVLVFPHFGDQPIVARRVEERKAGMDMSDNQSWEAIKHAVEEVLANDSYSENAKKIGESLRECGGNKEAAEHIHAILHPIEV